VGICREGRQADGNVKAEMNGLWPALPNAVTLPVVLVQQKTHQRLENQVWLM